MRTTFDFAPLFRSSIGFDRMLDALETASRVTSVDNWPPYDIVKTGEDDYHISMAVAGFTQDDLTIMQEQNMLIVIGPKISDEEDDRQYLLLCGGCGGGRFCDAQRHLLCREANPSRPAQNGEECLLCTAE
jgi:HSP20 family molecular chaperone IbpA